MTEPGRVLERRIVSVLFADLVGFTPLSERLDAEDVSTIQGRYFAVVRDTLQRYGGTVEKFIGDAVMAVFGVPVARDDDAERAVRAGLSLTSAVERLGVAVGLDHGDLVVRVGIATGEVVYEDAGPDQGRLTGDTVNTAARLQTAAPAGRVLVGATTALAAAEGIETGPLEPHVLKGKAEPVPAALAIGPRPERSREAAMGGLRAPMLGRGHELAVLERARRDAIEAAATLRCLVVAPPGTGKTRLLDEFAVRALRDGAKVRRLRFRADDARPFGALADLFGPADAAALGAAGLPADQRALAVAALAQLGGGATTVIEDRQVLFDALLDAADAWAGAAPTASAQSELWLAEDVHWANADALAFLDAALAREARVSRLVVASARPSLLDQAPAWAAASDRARRLDLRGLAEADAAALVQALVGDALSPALVARVVAASDGNCLYIEELLRTWASVGVLRPQGVAWVLDGPADAIAFPATVQAVYAAQLDDLAPDARLLARRGAVAGRLIPAGAVWALGFDAVAAESALASLLRRGLLDGPVDGGSSGPSYAYRHALLRDAAYASLAHAERALLHVAMAHWLADAAADRVDDVAAAIGEHYARAADGAPRLAAEVAPGLDRVAANALAAAWLDRAGAWSEASGAHAAAADLYGQAADRADPADSLTRSRLHRRAGEIAATVGDMDAAVERLDAALDAARDAAAAHGIQAGSPARDAMARAAASLARVHGEQLRFERSWQLAEAVLAELGGTADGPDVGDAASAWLALRAAVAHGLFDDDGGELAATAARAHAAALAAGDVELELEALAIAMSAAVGTSEVIRTARELGAVAEAHHRWDLVVRALRAEASAAAEAGLPTEALLAQAADIARAHGFREPLAWVHFLQAEIAFAAGDWATAVEAGRAALEIGVPRAYHRVCARTWFVLVPIAAARGDEATLRRARDWLVQNEAVFPDSPYGRLNRAAVDVAIHGAGLGPRPALEPAALLPSFDTVPESVSWLESADAVLRAWLERGWIEPASQAVDACRTRCRQSPDALSDGALALFEARAARVRGDGPTVSARVRVALEAFRQTAAPWWEAKALRLLDNPAASAAANEIAARLGANR